jgi:hypothetical protein
MIEFLKLSFIVSIEATFGEQTCRQRPRFTDALRVPSLLFSKKCRPHRTRLPSERPQEDSNQALGRRGLRHKFSDGAVSPAESVSKKSFGRISSTHLFRCSR